ncbi:MAG TPA: cyclic nucleotide-binding domain-containing protein, partial [Myxococcota bacterium]|nr:cyclic nucleotide-binding domain-containing protein [Myxococcota bacterium]
EVDHDIDGATLTPAPSGTAAVRAASRPGGPCVGDRVREHSLFRGLTHGEWLRMFSSTPRQCFESGATIFSAGELSDGMYAILCGSVEVTKDGNVIKVFGPGSTLGEMCLVDERVRLANAVARGRTVLMFLSRHSFQTMCDKQPVTAVRLLRQLQSRTASWLRDARDELNIMKAFVAGFEAERLDSVDR